MQAIDRSAVIDELGRLQNKLALMKPDEKRANELKKLVESWYEDQPADASFTAEGRIYQVQVSARKLERSVPLDKIKKLFRDFTLPKFLNMVRVSLTDFDRTVPEDDRARYLNSGQTGSRTVNTVVKLAEVEAKLPAAA